MCKHAFTILISANVFLNKLQIIKTSPIVSNRMGSIITLNMYLIDY